MSVAGAVSSSREGSKSLKNTQDGQLTCTSHGLLKI